MQQADLAIVSAGPDASTIKVEQIRELLRSLALTPYEAAYRVALLLNFETATPSAQNALLKTLEEAPSRAILLVTASAAEDLLPTIVSRCEVLRLRSMPYVQLAGLLQSKAGLSSERALELAHLSGGRPGNALRMQADPSELERREQWLDELVQALGSDLVERFKLAETIAKDKEKLRQALIIWSVYWRDVMLAAGGSSAPLTNLDRQGEIRELAEKLGFNTAHRLASSMEQALVGLDANQNTRLLVEVLLMDMPKVQRLAVGS
jgi:DNA polymerase-3 subunit delta'